jgi:hypothetical protein
MSFPPWDEGNRNDSASMSPTAVPPPNKWTRAPTGSQGTFPPAFASLFPATIEPSNSTIYTMPPTPVYNDTNTTDDGGIIEQPTIQQSRASNVQMRLVNVMVLDMEARKIFQSVVEDWYEDFYRRNQLHRVMTGVADLSTKVMVLSQDRYAPRTKGNTGPYPVLVLTYNQDFSYLPTGTASEYSEIMTATANVAGTSLASTFATTPASNTLAGMATGAPVAGSITSAPMAGNTTVQARQSNNTVTAETILRMPFILDTDRRYLLDNLRNSDTAFAALMQPIQIFYEPKNEPTTPPNGGGGDDDENNSTEGQDTTKDFPVILVVTALVVFWTIIMLCLLYIYRRRRRSSTTRSIQSGDDPSYIRGGGSLLSVYTGTNESEFDLHYGFSKPNVKKAPRGGRRPVRVTQGMSTNESVTNTSSESIEFLEVDEQDITDEERSATTMESSTVDTRDTRERGDDSKKEPDTDEDIQSMEGAEYFAPLGVPLSGHDRRRSSGRSKFDSDVSTGNQTPNTYAYDDDDEGENENSITGEFVGSDDDYRTTGTSDTSGGFSGMPSLASMNSAPIRIDIYAPVGKLGLVIETADHGVPVIHSVHPSSPVVDQVFPGDELIAVDDQDITGMTAMDVSRLLAYKTSTKVSKWTLLRSVRADGRFAGSVQSDSSG